MVLDPRLTPANGRVAAVSLKGLVEAAAFVEGEAAAIVVPIVDLLPAPGKRRERQLLLGAAVTVYERRDGWAFVQAAADAYVGYVPEDAVGPAIAPTHFVSSLATHAYETESMKSSDLMRLSLGSGVVVTAELRHFWETPQGFIPKKHLREVSRPFTDPATVVQQFFNTPYLWGGNSSLGIDCSGLVHAALQACDIPCPGDADLQCADLGSSLPDGTPPQRGDLYFWKGHVGMLVDPETLLHANAHHMATVYEPITAAILRIEAQGDGKVTRRARL